MRFARDAGSRGRPAPPRRCPSKTCFRPLYGGTMDPASIDPRSLHSQLGTARAPLVIDVRRDPAFEDDPHLIAGAVRPSGDLVDFVRSHARGRAVVAYCVKGAEVGVGAATTLAAAGYDATYLAGGLLAWQAEGLPTIRRKPEG